MDTLEFILGLMRQNTNALGFIPSTTVDSRYVTNGLYLVKLKTGYLLHGVPKTGQRLTIAQHCVEFDKRNHGHGMDLVNQLIERAALAQCKNIVLRCADGLPANDFWLLAGFEHTATLKPGNQRKRAINVYTLDLWRTLFSL
jgi:hypothetical protein